jgi:hypothetical protein
MSRSRPGSARFAPMAWRAADARRDRSTSTLGAVVRAVHRHRHARGPGVDVVGLAALPRCRCLPGWWSAARCSSTT